MNKKIPDSLQFFPPAVDGYFWKQFSSLLPYLADPQELVKLFEEDFEAYKEVTTPYIKYVMATEKELLEKNLLEDA